MGYATEDVPPKVEGEQRHNHAFEVGENDMFLTAPPMPIHIWRVPVARCEPRRLTSDHSSPRPTLVPVLLVSDGRTIAFARGVRPHSGLADRFRSVRSSWPRNEPGG